MLQIKEYSAKINGWIDDIQYPLAPAGLYEPIKYMLSGGGKRIRPTLLCAAAEAFGTEADSVKNQALAIEMFHNFTLLHDDVMDNASVRHGKPTVHCEWNVPTAILSGDAMLTLATVMMSRCDSKYQADILQLFNKIAIEVYEGQQFDMNFETLHTVTEEDYLHMIKLKTAVLLGCACQIGVMMAGGTVDDSEKMYQYGINLGLAFQLRDDYLDTFGDASTFGKAIGGDILNDKQTWLRVKARETCPDDVEVCSRISGPDEKIASMTELYKRVGVDKQSMSLVGHYSRLAVETVSSLPIEDDAKKFFINLALNAMERTH